ncbi:MAG: rhomboid family intramembrane serine protease [Prolixibacteraceae bacterium]
MRLFNYYPSNPRNLDPELEKKIFHHSLILPAAFVAVLWIVEIIEQVGGFDFVRLGVYPHHLKGLPGILFSPFIHSDFGHLISNSVPFFILSAMLVYFYRRISYRIFIQLYILAGICVWIAGREAWHIGASGVVYALAAFHFVSGIIRNDVRLLTVSVVVVFLYGGLIWGMMPINPEISWEGHLWGAVSGVVLALYYRKYGIRREKFDWEYEEEDEEVGSDPPQLTEEEETNNEQSKSQSSEKNRNENRKPGNVSHTGEF